LALWAVGAQRFSRSAADCGQTYNRANQRLDVARCPERLEHQMKTWEHLSSLISSNWLFDLMQREARSMSRPSIVRWEGRAEQKARPDLKALFGRELELAYGGARRKSPWFATTAI
jgi:hypothetical protein